MKKAQLYYLQYKPGEVDLRTCPKAANCGIAASCAAAADCVAAAAAAAEASSPSWVLAAPPAAYAGAPRLASAAESAPPSDETAVEVETISIGTAESSKGCAAAEAT